MTAEEQYKHALRFVNERRKEAGLRATSRLSKGFKGIATLCPIAKSLEKVGVVEADYDGECVILRGYSSEGMKSTREWKDPATARFMEDCDAGLYPALIITPRPIKINGQVVA